MAEDPSSTGPLAQSAVKKPWTKPCPRPVPRPPALASFESINNFPDDILFTIGDNSRVRDVFNFMRVSRRFYRIMKSCLWQKAEHRLFWYPMFFGAAKGDIPLMEEALRRGCSVNKAWLCVGLPSRKENFTKGHTPLHLAVKRGNADAVDWLLAQGANTDIKYPRWLPREDFSLLVLTVGEIWTKNKNCFQLGEGHVERMTRDWNVPTGPRYRIFSALLQAGVKLPQGAKWDYFVAAACCCPLVSAPTFQLLLQHGENIHELCYCDRVPPPQIAVPDEYVNCWFWHAGPAYCYHDADFVPFSKADREKISVNICDTLRAADDAGRRLFSLDDD